MDKLMKERLSLRDEQLKQLCAAATDITNRAQTEGVSLEELTTVKVKLMTATKKFEEDFFKLIKCSPNLDIKEQERYTLNQMKAEDLSAELETIYQLTCQKRTCNETQIMGTKLPKLELMKFNGDVLKWQEFWDKFESNIHNQPLNKADKLSYLFSSLEGKALDTLRGIDITNNGYDVAVNILKDRFGDKSLVVDAHYEALSRLPQSSNDSLRSTLDAIVKHIRILDSLGEDTKGNNLRSLICSKFPNSIIYELNLITPKNRDLDTTVKGLEKIINAKERSEFNNVLDVPDVPDFKELGHSTEALHVKPVLKRKPIHHGYNIHHSRRKPECAFCKGAHYSEDCKEYKTFYDRQKALKYKCYRCFKHGHPFRNCSLRIPCHHCQGNHNRAMCRKILQQHISMKKSEKTKTIENDDNDKSEE
ncbi:uncharacterized protein LOC126381439 [Pectinophora gossypiella]|uniref:uncharacterized protein LOC126381439 n=1 Tax=Pectinophora gossypiella TaxID=13191 RepID=UPI00214EEA66|nr:uncharacterized protein LOC126381439 [Pectinophora gossypiella]